MRSGVVFILITTSCAIPKDCPEERTTYICYQERSADCKAERFAAFSGENGVPLCIQTAEAYCYRFKESSYACVTPGKSMSTVTCTKNGYSIRIAGLPVNYKEYQ